MVVSLLKPQANPVLHAVGQGSKMMNRDDNQMGQGRFGGCNGSQLRHAKLAKKPSLLYDPTVAAKISGETSAELIRASVAGGIFTGR